MSQSVKLKDGSYIDASGVWDNTQGKSQEAFNSGVQHIKYATQDTTSNSKGVFYLKETNVLAAWDATTGYLICRNYSRGYILRNASTMEIVANTTITVNYLYVDVIDWTPG